MKIRELFDYIMLVKPHTFSDSVQLLWLNELEGRVQLDIWLMAPVEVKSYELPADEGAELLVSVPHTGIYRYWMEAMLDLERGEYQKYQNSMEAFNAAWNEYACWFAETQGTEGDGVSHGFYLSAYGIAVKHGYTGSEEEWLKSLKGEKGDPFTYEDFTEEQLQALKDGVVQDALDEANAAVEAAGQILQENQGIRDIVLGAANEAADAASASATNAGAAARSAQEANDGAKNANESAIAAEQSAASIAGMTVQAETLTPGSQATVSAELENGVYKMQLGIPAGKNGMDALVVLDNSQFWKRRPVGSSGQLELTGNYFNRMPGRGETFFALCDQRYYTIFEVTSLGYTQGYDNVVRPVMQYKSLYEYDLMGPAGDDGVSPVVEVTETEGGHKVTITDAKGTKEFEVLDGGGAPLYRNVWNTDLPGTSFALDFLALSKMKGAKTANMNTVQPGDIVIGSDGAVLYVVEVRDELFGQPIDDPVATFGEISGYLDWYGEPGMDGEDGVSPTVEVAAITGGHRLTITDARGTRTVDVMDGAPGATPYVGGNGNWWIGDGDTGIPAAGKTPVKGTDYWTEEDKQEIVDGVVEQIPPTGIYRIEEETPFDFANDKYKFGQTLMFSNDNELWPMVYAEIDVEYRFRNVTGQGVQTAVLNHITGWSFSEEEISGDGGATVLRVRGPGSTASGYDYECDGVDDQVEIQAAIDALPATGGIIELGYGTYNISGVIDVSKRNVTIRGNAAATLKRAAATTRYTGNPLLCVSTGFGCSLRNIKFDGVKETYSATGTTSLLVNSSDVTVTECTFLNADIGVQTSLAEALFERCIFQDNRIGVYSNAGDSFTLDDSLLERNAFAVYMRGQNKVKHCVIRDNDVGIRVETASAGGSNPYEISENLIYRGTGTEADYSADQHTVYLATNVGGALVTGNTLLGKDVTDASGKTTNIISNGSGGGSGGVSSWNDLTDKPFGEEMGEVETPLNIEWDGNTDGREVVLMPGQYGMTGGFCKMLDTGIPAESLEVSTFTGIFAYHGEVEEHKVDGENYVVADLTEQGTPIAAITSSNGESIYVASVFDNCTYNGLALTPGLYFMFVQESGEFAVRMKSLHTTYMTEGTVIKPIDPKYIKLGSGLTVDENGAITLALTNVAEVGA